MIRTFYHTSVLNKQRDHGYTESTKEWMLGQVSIWMIQFSTEVYKQNLKQLCNHLSVSFSFKNKAIRCH